MNKYIVFFVLGVIIFYAIIGAIAGYFLPFVSIMSSIKIGIIMGIMFMFVMSIIYGGNKKRTKF